MDLDAPISISPSSVFGFMIALFVIGAVIVLYRARKTQNNVLYMGSGFLGAMAFAFLVGALGQYLLCLILMGVFTLVCYIVLMPKLMQNRNNEFIKDIEKMDTSEPIRLREFFSFSFIIKLERAYGKYKAMVICATVCTGLFSAFMFVMYLLDFMTLSMVGAFTGVLFVVFCVLYWQIRDGRMPGRLRWMTP